jgi:hypothetical protein
LPAKNDGTVCLKNRVVVIAGKRAPTVSASCASLRNDADSVGDVRGYEARAAIRTKAAYQLPLMALSHCIRGQARSYT